MPATVYSLNVIDVKEPCTASWEEMRGDEVRRFCGHCQLNVYDLSAMSRQEAENFVAASGGQACVRFYRRADGTVVTADCQNAWRRAAGRAARSTRRLVGATVSAIAAVLAVGLMGNRAVGSIPHGTQPHPRATPMKDPPLPPPNPGPILMGKIICRPPTTEPVAEAPAPRPDAPAAPGSDAVAPSTRPTATR